MQIRHKNSTHACWYAEAICLGVTIGFSEVLLSIYYGSKAMDAVTLAIFMTVPAAFGALTQAAMTRLHKIFLTARRLAICAIGLQILGLLLMASALHANNSDHLMMFVGQCLYWMGGMTSTSPTQEILAHGVDSAKHNQFFSRRAMVMTLLTLACNLSSAKILSDGLTPGLMAEFLVVAAIARTTSLAIVFFFSEDAPHPTNRPETVEDDEVVVSIMRLGLVMMLFRCAVNMSSPFYSAYMLREIQLDFGVYSLLTAIPLITKTLCLTNWARLLDDNRKFEGLAIATFTIGLVPVMWSIWSSPTWLGILQILSGLSWAGFDLISILLIQHMYPRSITQKLGLYLAMSSLGSVAGGLIGGYILRTAQNYNVLFALSGVLRLVTGFGLLWYLRRNHLFRFQDLRLKSGLATLMTVRPSLEAAAKILPLSTRKNSRSNRAA